MSVTIRDVARMAKVSPATVSRVLNGAVGVRPETRDRVVTALRRLNFSPSPSARNLRSGRTEMAGVVVPDLGSLFFTDVIKGLENTLTLSDYRVAVCDSQGQVKKERENCRWLMDGSVDALMLISPMMDDDALLELAEMGIPLGLFGRMVDHPNVTCIGVNNRGAGSRVVEHLVNHGHRKIGVITGSPGHADAGERLAGYYDTLKRLGLPENPDWVQCGFLAEDGGARAFESMMARPDRPTAVFAVNDEMALGALLAARRLGIQVPKDVALVGFDNLRLARLVAPALTTVNQPKLEIGFRLAQNMLQRLSGSADPERVVLPTDLVARESCGCA